MALSRADPTLPIEGTMPASSSLLLSDSTAYCTSLSERWTSLTAGFLLYTRHLKGVDYELGAQMIRYTPSYDHPRVDVEDEGQVEEAPVRTQLRCDRRPKLVWGAGAEVPLHKIRSRRGVRISVGGSPLSPTPASREAALSPQTGNPLPSAAHSQSSISSLLLADTEVEPSASVSAQVTLLTSVAGAEPSTLSSSA